MHKKEFISFIKQLAPHFGEQVSCEWLSAGDGEWTQWNNAEINTQFLINLEKGNIRNIRIPQTSITIQSELITIFNTLQEWEDKASSFLQKYGQDEIVCVDQCGKILLSEKDFSFAHDEGLFPVNAYQMLRSAEKCLLE